MKVDDDTFIEVDIDVVVVAVGGACHLWLISTRLTRNSSEKRNSHPAGHLVRLA